MVRGNVQAISTSIEPSSFFVTEGAEVDDTETSTHGRRTVLERLVMGGERRFGGGAQFCSRNCVLVETRTATALSLHFWVTPQMQPVSFRPRDRSSIASRPASANGPKLLSADWRRRPLAPPKQQFL